MQNSPSINYQSYLIELYGIDKKWLSARYFNHIFLELSVQRDYFN